MRWQVIAIALCPLLAHTGARAADKAPPVDADLAKEADTQDDAANVDAGTGKTLQERIRAVSRRTFLKQGRFEINPLAGISTNDPFFRAWTVGARGSYHLSEEFSIDFGGAGAVYQEPLDIFRALNVDPEKIAGDLKQQQDDGNLSSTLYGYADAGVTFSPFYGKVALASELVGHFDTFLSAGVAAVIDSGASVVHPGLEVGIGSRLFLNRWIVARVDVRDYLYPADSGGGVAFGNTLMLNVGLGLYFPLDFDYSNETLGAKD
ncbi:MAG: outer membrane beta-barrel domain-containing protein [Deltaproteobacteria bacterium]|nr:outer membrane beta-barrel domain-containing protein [Deltaproteobacteria bacterium]